MVVVITIVLLPLILTMITMSMVLIITILPLIILVMMEVMMLMTMMAMVMMMMTMTVIVMMSCGNSTFYVLIERTSTSQNAFCHCLYFLFSYKRSAALGQFVIHRGLIISVMQVGMLCILTSRTPCAERVD